MLKLPIQRWFADTARRNVCDFDFLTSSGWGGGGGVFYEFFMTVTLAIPPLTMKNRPCPLLGACALNRKNTVSRTRHDVVTVTQILRMGFRHNNLTFYQPYRQYLLVRK